MSSKQSVADSRDDVKSFERWWLIDPVNREIENDAARYVGLQKHAWIYKYLSEMFE